MKRKIEIETLNISNPQLSDRIAVIFTNFLFRVINNIADNLHDLVVLNIQTLIIAACISRSRNFCRKLIRLIAAKTK